MNRGKRGGIAFFPAVEQRCLPLFPSPLQGTPTGCPPCRSKLCPASLQGAPLAGRLLELDPPAMSSPTPATHSQCQWGTMARRLAL